MLKLFRLSYKYLVDKFKEESYTLKEIKDIYGIDLSPKKEESLRDGITIYKYAWEDLRVYQEKKQEACWVAVLDRKYHVIDSEVISVGVNDEVLVHPRELFKRAVGLSGNFIVIAHNHPSGNTKPSDVDLTETGRLTRAGELLGIPVLDSLVVSHLGYFSIRKEYPGIFDKHKL